MSVFTKAQQLEEEEDPELDDAPLQLVDHAVRCDNENWVEEFEARHANLERVPMKEKHQKTSMAQTAKQPKKIYISSLRPLG